VVDFFGGARAIVRKATLAKPVTATVCFNASAIVTTVTMFADEWSGGSAPAAAHGGNASFSVERFDFHY